MVFHFRTKETLESGHYMSVINILMQLRKVCNHPNLFDPRPIVSPFQMEGITYQTPSAVLKALQKEPLEVLRADELYPNLCNLELQLPAFGACRTRKLQTPRKLIEEIDRVPSPPPRPRPLEKPLKLPAKSAATAGDRESPFASPRAKNKTAAANKTTSDSNSVGGYFETSNRILGRSCNQITRLTLFFSHDNTQCRSYAAAPTPRTHAVPRTERLHARSAS